MGCGHPRNLTVNVRTISLSAIWHIMFLVLSVAIPLNVTGSDVTDVTFRLSWLLPPTVGNIINHYVIRITELITGKVSTFFSVEATVTITSLHPYYYYNCQVALASTFIHPFANPVIIRTLEAGKKTKQDMLKIYV